MTRTHETLVDQQFGARAAAYVASAVHASGADLARMAAIAAAHAPAHALDLGCGGGHVSYAIAPYARAVAACDLAPQMLAAVAAEAQARGAHHIATHAAAAEALPFADGAFDFLACRFSAHHWADVRQGLAEARRVLRPGAPAVFVDVIAPEAPAADTHLQAVELLRDPSHVRDYRRSEWRAMVAEAGFAITAETPARLRMDFASWTARMATPAPHIAAIRSLQGAASHDVAGHFAIEADGSFTIDTLLIELR
ncbi:MAG TPA: class I SAM-dependent methyltransferase [Novosphingobium sp.]|nr:class I SAM-dependent methyltransferase [Novosphingobium sp.]